MMNYSSTIIRSLRKFHQLGQVELAKDMGFSQSRLSKVEHGVLELSASEWVYLCRRFMIDPYSISSGKIELMGDTLVDFDSSEVGKCFKIPRRFLVHSGSTIRSMYPLLQFFYSHASKQTVNTFFITHKIDQDYLTFLSNPVNLIFAQELVSFMVREKILTKENFHHLVSSNNFRTIHSIPFAEGLGISFDRELGKLLEHINKYYEINTNYTQCNSTTDVMHALDNLHVPSFKLTPEFNHFRMNHNLLHIQALAKLTGDRRQYEVRPSRGGWIISAH